MGIGLDSVGSPCIYYWIPWPPPPKSLSSPSFLYIPTAKSLVQTSFISCLHYCEVVSSAAPLLPVLFASIFDIIARVMVLECKLDYVILQLSVVLTELWIIWPLLTSQPHLSDSVLILVFQSHCIFLAHFALNLFPRPCHIYSFFPDTSSLNNSLFFCLHLDIISSPSRFWPPPPQCLSSSLAPSPLCFCRASIALIVKMCHLEMQLSIYQPVNSPDAAIWGQRLVYGGLPLCSQYLTESMQQSRYLSFWSWAGEVACIFLRLKPLSVASFAIIFSLLPFLNCFIFY